MKKAQFSVKWIVLITSFVNLILGITLIVQSERKEWRIFIAGATIVSIVAAFAMSTACLRIVWPMCTVSVCALLLGIYFAVVVVFYSNSRFPEHEKRLWKRYFKTGFVDRIQREYHCCGKNGPNYYANKNLRIPVSCYVSQNVPGEVWKEPCFPHMQQLSMKATSLLTHYMLAIAIIGVGIAAQALALIILDNNRQAKQKAEKDARAVVEKRLQKEHDGPSGSPTYMQTGNKDIENEKKQTVQLEDETSDRLYFSPTESLSFDAFNLSGIHTKSRIDIFADDEIKLPTEWNAKVESTSQSENEEVLNSASLIENASQEFYKKVVKIAENETKTKNEEPFENQAKDKNPAEFENKRVSKRQMDDDDAEKKKGKDKNTHSSI